MTRNNKLMLVSLILWGIGEGLFVFIETVYLEQLGANPVQVGGALALANIAALATFLPAGWLSDRFDRKLNMLAGYFFGGLAVLVMALASEWRLLVVGLILYQFSGFCIPAITSYVAQEAPPRDRNRTINTVFAGYTAGLVVSPVVGGWLADRRSMRVVFLVAFFVFFLAFLIAVFVKRQPRAPVVASMVSAWSEVWREPRVPRLVGLLALFFFVVNLSQPLAPNFLARAGYDLSALGFLGSVHALGAAILGLVLGRLDERGTRGLLLGGATIGLYAALLAILPPPPVVILAFALRGVIHPLRAIGAARLGAEVADRNLGTAYGFFNSVQSASLIVASYLAGLLFDVRPALPLLVTLVALPPTLALVWLHERRVGADRPIGAEGAS